MKRTPFYLLLVLLAAALGSHQAFAVPALEESQQVTQPDGKTFTAVPRGDEWNNRTETAEGYSVAQDALGTWRYVKGFKPDNTPVLDNTPAHFDPPPGLGKHLRSLIGRPFLAPGEGSGDPTAESGPSSAPQQTNSPVLFILTEFNDRAGSTSVADWEGFVSDNVSDFYAQTSHGNAILNPALESDGASNGVIGWVNLGYNHPNTRGNTGTTNRNLTRDAILAANPYIDYASFDTNGDAYIDGNELSVVIIVAGYETAYGGTSGALSPSVWGHKWSVNASADGVTIGPYAQFGEFHATSLSNEHQATMGIMVHELGHLTYGLPDLYDTNGGSDGIGPFGVMSGGSWGKSDSDTWSGQTPVNACAWSKYHLNWVAGFEGSGSESIAASGSGDASNTVFRGSSGVSNEYFLVENRQPVGYDLGLERYLGGNFGGGLAIWHIDDSRSSNADQNHRWVDIEEADGTTASSGNSALWTSANGVQFNELSNPDSDLYDGSSSGVAITNISVSASSMSADFGAVAPTAPDAPSNLVANATSASAISLIWNDNSPNEDGFQIERSPDGTTWATTIADNVAANSQNYSDTALAQETTYHYRVRAFNTVGDSAYSNPASATTQAPPPPSPMTPEVLGAIDNTDGSTTLSWTDVDNEDGYEIQREKAHKKRAGVWNSTTLIGGVSSDVTSMIDSSGTGTFRYRIRAFNSSGSSAWSAWQEITVTDSNGGGGGGKCHPKRGC